jgi:serine/threonine protein kinase
VAAVNTNRNTRSSNASAAETSVSDTHILDVQPLNFESPVGAAFLVKNKLEGGKEYIAKKILLGALGDKEQEGALMEVNLLKNLQHPNIVGYKTSYIH